MPGVDEAKIRAWQRILRDFVIVGVGSFMLIHEKIVSRDPNIYVISAGLVMLGVPPALRLDEGLRRGGRKNDDDAS